MNKNLFNTNTERSCFRCKQVYPTTLEYFYKDSKRILGLSYECKSCLSKRKKGRDRRKEKWSNLTDEQKIKVKQRTSKYNKTIRARAVFLSSAYKKIDLNKNHLNNITSEFLLNEIFTSFCVYCGTNSNLGCDRIDNTKGHLIENVVAACGDCNIMRGNRFTYEEMLIIGKTIAYVKSIRDTASNSIENDNHL